MRRSPLLLAAFLLLGGTSAIPQSRSASFNKFRERALNDYNSFRERVLEHYADFLNGTWHEFEPLWEEESPYTQPKPTKLPPVAPAESAPAPAVAKLPAPKFGKSSPGGMLAAVPGGGLAEGSISGYTKPSRKIDRQVESGSMPGIAAKTPKGAKIAMADAAKRSNYELAVLRLPDPGFAFGDFPGQTAAPDPKDSGIVSIDMSTRPVKPQGYTFDFYGMEAFIPEIDFSIAESMTSPDQAGAHWKKMADQDGGLETARQLFGLAQQLGLNGYLTFRLVESYADQKFKDSDPGARMSAVHFLLTNMGYDVRLCRLGDRFTVMMPFDQKVVYSSMSQSIDGRKYTILYPEGYQPPMGQSMSLLTCKLPAGSLGKTSDLRLTGLNLPMKGKSFTLSNGKMKIEGEVNENIRQLLHRYPQMPTGDFASSWVDEDLRGQIVSQVKDQLAGKTQREAVNTLMGLCHDGFNYSTDQEFHGFEKPYFFEENLIYDKNDCEDRAIFFSYLLWNALGLPCQLIQYPGHESATVAVNEDIAGYFYDTDGTKYYSADPTYIGSTVGMVMKAFRNAAPTVDKQYH